MCVTDAQAHQWQWAKGRVDFPDSRTPVPSLEFTREPSNQQRWKEILQFLQLDPASPKRANSDGIRLKPYSKGFYFQYT